MGDYPVMAAEVNRVEPVPRRIRAFLGGECVIDTIRARYVWEWANYPQYYIPIGDIRPGVLVDEQTTQRSRRGDTALHGVELGELRRPHAAKVLRESTVEGLSETVRFEWSAFDAWFEEDEQVFLHPRNPYVRVDALRSSRTIRVEVDGMLLAETSSPVLVFETGLPTRIYIDRTDVDFTHLVASDTVSECPYKGTTSGYWSVRIGDVVRDDLAWSYGFPTRELLPISGLIAFYNERTDVFVDGQLQERPVTHLARNDR